MITSSVLYSSLQGIGLVRSIVHVPRDFVSAEKYKNVWGKTILILFWNNYRWILYPTTQPELLTFLRLPPCGMRNYGAENNGELWRYIV